MSNQTIDDLDYQLYLSKNANELAHEKLDRKQDKLDKLEENVYQFKTQLFSILSDAVEKETSSTEIQYLYNLDDDLTEQFKLLEEGLADGKESIKSEKKRLDYELDDIQDDYVRKLNELEER